MHGRKPLVSHCRTQLCRSPRSNLRAQRCDGLCPWGGGAIGSPLCPPGRAAPGIGPTDAQRGVACGVSAKAVLSLSLARVAMMSLSRCPHLLVANCGSAWRAMPEPQEFKEPQEPAKRRRKRSRAENPAASMVVAMEEAMHDATPQCDESENGPYLQNPPTAAAAAAEGGSDGSPPVVVACCLYPRNEVVQNIIVGRGGMSQLKLSLKPDTKVPKILSFLRWVSGHLCCSPEPRTDSAVQTHPHTHSVPSIVVN